TLMAGLGITFLFPRQAAMTTAKKRARRTSGHPGRPRSVVTAIVFVGLLVLGSWGTTMLSDSFTLTQANAQAQNNVYQAIQWLGSNTSAASAYLSVSDWRFTYTGLLIGRNSFYQFESTPQTAIPAAKTDGAEYIIVTNTVTVSLPPVPSLFPWNNFAPSSNLTMVYSNPDVEVFQIV